MRTRVVRSYFHGPAASPSRQLGLSIVYFVEDSSFAAANIVYTVQVITSSNPACMPYQSSAHTVFILGR